MSLSSSRPRIIRPCSTNSRPTTAQPRFRCAAVSRQSLCPHGRLCCRDLELVRLQLKTDAPDFRAIGGRLIQPLRYGENPHQTAAFYRTPDRRPAYDGAAAPRQGLSYNNINDTDAAYECIGEFDAARTAACVIVKHANPCGVAEGPDLVTAYRRAFACDTQAPYGGIIAVNRTLDAAAARAITES